MDGGDITFEKYEDGILFLQMKGACAGCPSSTMTLKMGIENRIRQIIPDLIDVVAV
jgi:Fe-S cluster biogenesis protein NfuA